MQRKKYLLLGLALCLSIIVVTLAVSAWQMKRNADALWQIVNGRCVPGEKRGDPAPCQQVNMREGFVTLKDRQGPLQYLLLPVTKVSGIESPQLLNPDEPDFFALAWQQRGLLAQKRGAPIDDLALSLAINSEYGRTQNQLHIHISCLRADVRDRVNQLSSTLGSQWQPQTLRGHHYLLRALSQAELAQQSVFIRLANERPEAREQMGKYGLALAALPDGRLVLMAVERNWLGLNRGSAEELQDHQCGLLKGGVNAALATSG